MENHSHPNYNIQLPYSKTNYLLTIPERRFYEKLCAMIPENLTILPQVAISSIVKVISHQITFKIRRKKISNKKIDFVIFKKRFLEPVLAIEYDDKTHERSDRKARDSFVNKVLDSSWIPIYIVSMKKLILVSII